MKRYGFLPLAAFISVAAGCADNPTAVPDEALLARGGGGNPHFVSSSASIVASGSDRGKLAVAFKEAGLSSGTVIVYQVAATGNAEWACINGGNKNPSATNKRSASTPVVASVPLTVPKNGNITATILAGPPAKPAGWSCPNGQREELLWVSYTNVQLTDSTNGLNAFNPPASVGPQVFYAL